MIVNNKMKSLGIDIGGTNIKYGVIDTNNKLVFSKFIDAEIKSGKDSVIEKLKSIICNCKRNYDISYVGVGIAGLVDKNRGIVLSSPNLPDWNNVHLKNKLEELGLPVILDNDANCFILGEYIAGAGQGYKDILGIAIGTGIGGGIIVHGKLYNGKNNYAGEFGHTKVVPNGRLCNCGQKGCIEAYASGFAVTKIAQEKYGAHNLKCKRMTPKILYELAQNGDKIAQKIYKQAFYYLGISMSNLINIFNPEAIIFGGGMSKMGDFMLKQVEKIAMEHSFKPSAKNVEFKLAKLGDNAGIVGAGNLHYQAVAL